MILFSKNAHIAMIEDIAKGMEAAGMNGAYLELGIAKGACFNIVAPHFKKATAVDMNFECYERVCKITQNKGNAFYAGTTDDYFKNNKDPVFDMIFIDACHKYEFVEKDFRNSLGVLKNNGLIIMHDTYPPNEEYLEHCQDAWKIREYLKRYKYEAVTLPFYYGLTIVRKD
jgi:predicted O-methyltransferase YrrM